VLAITDEAYKAKFLQALSSENPDTILPSFEIMPEAVELPSSLPADSPLERALLHRLHPDHSPPTSTLPRKPHGPGIERLGRLPDREIVGDFV
jgi:hypothetical protein